MDGLEYNATVIQRVEVAPGLIILRVVPDVLPFRFVAGQYTVLGLRRLAARVPEAEAEETPEEIGETGEGATSGQDQADPHKMIRRAYSIASSSDPNQYVEFYLTQVSSGELTPRLFALKPGDRLYLGPKAAGLFTLDRVPEGFHALLVATGTGLAPYMSMLRSELICGGPRRFVVLHGARFSWDLGYRAELTALARHCRNLIYLPVLSRPKEDLSWTGMGGYLQDVLLSPEVEARAGFPVRPERTHVFLCGNPGMIEAVKERLSPRGFVPDRGKVSGSLHVEEYW
jgi:ferredoxin/flavodoxin---NADP+ reductase